MSHPFLFPVFRAHLVAIGLCVSASACGTVKSAPSNEVSLRISLGFDGCKSKFGFDCIQVVMVNNGDQSIAIPTMSYLGADVVPPNYGWIEYLDQGGSWTNQVFELATYDTPTNFVTLNRGETGTAVIQAFAPTAEEIVGNGFNNYRAVLIDWNNETHMSTGTQLP